jgi:periplasmic protein TonB
MAVSAALQRSNRVPALAGTVIFHLVLLSIFFVSMVKMPEPVATGGGDGIVLNYGTDTEGSGDVQTTAKAADTQNTEDSAPSNAEPQTQPEPAAPEPVQEQVAETPPTMTSDVEETVAVPVVEKPKKEVATAKETPKVTPKPTTNPAATYNPNAGGNGTRGTSNLATGNNNGDRPGKVGDQGDRSGSLDSKALYGSPGSGSGGSGGGSLEMPGWRWLAKPKPSDASSATGTLVFEIKVDENGEVQSIRKLAGQSTFNDPVAERFYINAIEKTEFERTTSAGEDRGAVGRIIFRIGAN